MHQSLAAILEQAVGMSASDIHLEAGSPICYRVSGELVYPDPELLDRSTVQRLVYGALTPEQERFFEEQRELDAAFELSGIGRFRMNVHMQQGVVGAALRTVPDEVPDLAGLGLPPVLEELPWIRNGLVLVTGATGSGKSTTLAAVIKEINQHRSARIVTIEDPVEYRHEFIRSVISQREVGEDTKSFSEALRRAMRQNPDVILVGELRDRESVSVALRAANTGVLVLATLHTATAKDTIGAIVDFFPGDEQNAVRSRLAASLRFVVAQVLCRGAGNNGGRLVATEILRVTPAVRNMIRDGRVHEIMSAIETGSGLGMCTMGSSLKELVGSGRITADEARRQAPTDEGIDGFQI
ncbi:MAG: PilT/PilU family type 4a pilus ATPase [Actinobacteria bacterium]|nr:PilT/PilU family type 4a pilus ATPase [Actinomycetota bacterium]